MRFIKNFLFWIFILLVVFIATLATAVNSESVVLSFAGVVTPSLPVSTWMVASFLSGAAITLAFTSWSNLKLRHKVRGQEKKVESTSKQVDKLRAKETGEVTASA